MSYGGVYETSSITHIGVIQCGFADGLPRPWYKRGYVSHNGKKFKIAGHICMDQFMVYFGNTILESSSSKKVFRLLIRYLSPISIFLVFLYQFGWI